MLAAEPGRGIPAPAARSFGEMVRRRLRREPVAYILGRRGFRSIELSVDPRVLVPRPETELLVELALELRPSAVLDVGTGSGAVALAIADELPGCEVTATDTSPAALRSHVATPRRSASPTGSASSPARCRRTGEFDLTSPTFPTSPRRLVLARARGHRVGAARGAARRARRPRRDPRPDRRRRVRRSRPGCADELRSRLRWRWAPGRPTRSRRCWRRGLQPGSGAAATSPGSSGSSGDGDG